MYRSGEVMVRIPGTTLYTFLTRTPSPVALKRYGSGNNGKKKCHRVHCGHSFCMVWSERIDVDSASQPSIAKTQDLALDFSTIIVTGSLDKQPTFIIFS